MKTPSTYAMLFNGAALLVVVASAAAIVRSNLFQDDAPACSERYEHGTRISLDRNGEPMTAADLQSRFGGTDWGLLDRAAVVTIKSGPAPVALELDVSNARPSSGSVKDGVGFIWAPRSFGKTGSACLGYSVFLPEKFEFGKGGRLPGLMGANLVDSGPEARPAFSVRYSWGPEGKGDIYSQIPAIGEGRSPGNDRSGFSFPRGRWVNLEQEVVLNTPQQKDGILRVWVDGVLKFEKTNVVFREDADAMITGVLSEAVATGEVAKSNVAMQKIRVTPFELRWK